jgi:hypothetical protein
MRKASQRWRCLPVQAALLFLQNQQIFAAATTTAAAFDDLI